MKRILMAAGFLAMAFGCERRASSADGRAEEDVRAWLQTLSCDSSVRAIRATGAVRECLRQVPDKGVRLALIRDWEAALRNVPLEGLCPGDRYWRAREACHVLLWDLACAMRDAGCSSDEIWREVFDTLAWLDRQVAAMKPSRVADVGSWAKWREEERKWSAYQALAEYRETVMENLERDWFDGQIYPNEGAQTDKVRRRLERYIGRRVRSREEITRLGVYVKQVRARIQKERAEAMKVKPAEDAAEAR